MPQPTIIPLKSAKPVQPPASESPRPGRMPLKHVLESQQFTVPLLMELFGRSQGMERVVARGGTLDYQHRIMTTLFYAPSTRTRLSFEAAMHRLGGRVLSTEHAGAFSSEIEGEQVEDSIRIISGYSDVIVIRHHDENGARRAAEVSQAPVINAGDGNGGQHPTQALLDLYTIYRQRPLDGLSVAIIGELDKGRTARSLAYLLAKFDRVKMFFVSPPQLQMKPDILAYLDEHGVRYELESDIDRVIGEVDVVYQTRIRPERVRDADGLRRYAIDSKVVQRMKPDALILHPLPRTVELDKSVDADPRAMYFRQAMNGLYVRMALLTMLLDKEPAAGSAWW
jgi:aspartate carbamoyltransferase catalytic subunit